MIDLRELKYKVGALSSVIIPLGVQGETGAETIYIDYSEWLADGTEGYPSILVLSPNGTRYPAATYREDEEDEDGSNAVLVWPITDIDTAEFGDGLIRVLLYSEGGVLMKSAEARFSIAPSFLKGDGGAPGQYEYWLEKLDERASRTGANSIAAKNAAIEAVNAATSSEAAYEAAKALITLLEAADDPGAYLDKAMVLSSKMPVSVAVSEWELVDGVYRISRENLAVLEDTAAVFFPDKSAGYMEDGIFADCGENVVYLTTDVLPTGTVTGTILLSGHMSIEPSIVPASTSATRAAASAAEAAASAAAAAGSESAADASKTAAQTAAAEAVAAKTAAQAAAQTAAQDAADDVDELMQGYVTAAQTAAADAEDSAEEAGQYAANAAANAELAAQHVYNISVSGESLTVTQAQHGFTMTVVDDSLVVADAT